MSLGKHKKIIVINCLQVSCHELATKSGTVDLGVVCMILDRTMEVCFNKTLIYYSILNSLSTGCRFHVIASL